ncbi:MAG: hypothetical protein ABW184_16645 [Sphingobium sp.]
MLTSIRFLLLGGATLATICAAPALSRSAYFAQADSGSGQSALTETDIASRLAMAIKLEISRQPATASAQDLEAVIVYIVNQGDYSDTTISSALDQVAAGASATVQEAVMNARRALLGKKRRGTGSFGAGNGGFGAFGAPGAPPGGGSNYQ